MEYTLEVTKFVIGMLILFSLYAYFTDENELSIVKLLLRVVFSMFALFSACDLIIFKTNAINIKIVPFCIAVLIVTVIRMVLSLICFIYDKITLKQLQKLLKNIDGRRMTLDEKIDYLKYIIHPEFYFTNIDNFAISTWIFGDEAEKEAEKLVNNPPPKGSGLV